MVARHGPEHWPGILRNQWPASPGIRNDPLYSLGGGVETYLNIYAAWQQAQVPAELHMFATGGHGFGIAPAGKSSDQWTALLDHWLRERGFFNKDRIDH
jgi:hypothetical protein